MPQLDGPVVGAPAQAIVCQSKGVDSASKSPLALNSSALRSMSIGLVTAIGIALPCFAPEQKVMIRNLPKIIQSGGV